MGLASNMTLWTALALYFSIHLPVATSLQVATDKVAPTEEDTYAQPAQPPTWFGQGRVPEAGKCNQGEALAVLVSGQSYRFIYKDMFERFGNLSSFFGCTVDLYVVLSSKRGQMWVRQEINTPYADDVLKDTREVANFLKRYGFNRVTIDVMPPEAVDFATDQFLHNVTMEGGGQAWFDSCRHRAHWRRNVFDLKVATNSQMLYLRSRVYNLARSSETQLPYHYSRFMYLREDTLFDQTPLDDLQQLLPRDEPAVEVMKVSTRCAFGGFSDKNYFGNRQGFDVLFGSDYGYHDVVNNFARYVNMLSSDAGAGTEDLTKAMLDGNGVKVMKVEFGTSDVRYAPAACTPGQYYGCTSHQAAFPPCPQFIRGGPHVDWWWAKA